MTSIEVVVIRAEGFDREIAFGIVGAAVELAVFAVSPYQLSATTRANAVFYFLLPLVFVGADGLVVLFALFGVCDVLPAQTFGNIGDVLYREYGFGSMQMLYGRQRFVETDDLTLFVVDSKIRRAGKNDYIVHGDLFPDVSVITNGSDVCLILP